MAKAKLTPNLEVLSEAASKTGIADIAAVRMSEYLNEQGFEIVPKQKEVKNQLRSGPKQASNVDEDN